MTEEEAKAEARKRNAHKSKYSNHNAWVAKQDSQGWVVSLVPLTELAHGE